MMKYKVTEHKGEKCTVRIHKPILSATERKTREDNVRAALMQFEIEKRSNKK